MVYCLTDYDFRDQNDHSIGKLRVRRKSSKYDFILKEGDVVSIPGRLETVRVAGEVTSPLNLRYDKSFTFKDYIDQSGGFL